MAVGLGWPVVDPPLLAAAGLLMLAASSLAAKACVGERRITYELWAVHYGLHLCLLRTVDVREFGQVRRALVRAFEAISEN